MRGAAQPHSAKIVPKISIAEISVDHAEPADLGSPGDPQASDRLPAYVVLLKSGPVYNPDDSLRFHARTVGLRAAGELRAFGPSPIHLQEGPFEVHCGVVPDDSGVAGKLRYLWRTIRSVVRVLRRSGRPGLVVSYDPFLNGLAGVAIKLLTDAKFICELNGAYSDLDNWGDASCPTRARRRRRMLAIGSFVLRRADGVRLLFDGQLAGFRLGTHRPVVRRYFDPVPIGRFRNLGEEKFVLLVGFPFHVKGADIAARAFARIRHRFPDWRLVMIGHQLAQHLPRAGVSLERIEALHAMTNTEVAEWIGRAGVVMLASRSEGLPRVLIEAGAAGKPRIGPEIYGVPHVIQDGVDGLLFPKGDEEALADRLSRLLDSTALRRQLGAAAAARVHREFSPERFAALFHEHATAVLSRP